MTDIFSELKARGLVSVSTDEAALQKALNEESLTYYVGFDPTAPSLHMGNLVQLITAARLQKAGHNPLALVGGATGLIGDPRMSGERTLNPREVVEEWLEKIRAQVEKFLDFSGPNAAQVVNNYEWTSEMSAIDFLRDIGKHFPMNRMLAKESVSARLNSEAGISFTEFSYQVLQGNDYLELHRRYGCSLQTGGSDQWGNLTSGVDLIRRVEQHSVHALATPLITKADGTKFGKTESGTVWLDESLTSPYAFSQFWLNADDRDVVKYLKVFSFRFARGDWGDRGRVHRGTTHSFGTEGAGRGRDDSGPRQGEVRAGDRGGLCPVRWGRAGQSRCLHPGGCDIRTSSRRCQLGPVGRGCTRGRRVRDRRHRQVQGRGTSSHQGRRCLRQQRQGHR